MLPPAAEMGSLQAKHCPLCGALLAPGQVEGRRRPRCTRCRYVLYQNPASAAGAVVVDARGRVLLIRRALEPFRGTWTLPAGYQEIDEEPARTAEREAQEESGLVIRAETLLDLLFVSDDPRKPANLALYLCRAVGGSLRPGDDALDAAWFDLDHLPAEIGFDNRTLVLDRLPESEAYRRLVTAMSSPQTNPPAGDARPSVSYKDAGVDIAKKYGAVEQARGAIRESYTPGVVGDIGLFGGLFDLERAGAGRGLLVASADGVGTKLEVARRAGVYSTVGQDLVNHCVNDILVQGARPLFFMDYVAVGKMEPEVVGEIIRGCALASRENGLALLGGETAEMPGLYKVGDFDLAGFIVGVVEPDRLLDGSRVRPGQALVALPSSGLHTNGYSLARKLAFEVLGLELEDRPEALGGASLGEALLAVHRSYLQPLWPLLEEGRVAAMAHITGGGLLDNVPRVLRGHDALIDRSSWEVPALFALLCEAGNVDSDEAYQAFNMGVGMVLFVDPDELDGVLARLRAAQADPFVIGRVEAGQGRVRWA
jgi:phosphoribosylformylglycinamidine cyclo-ligase